MTFQIELDFGQRQPAGLARQRQFADQRAEGVVLVFVHIEHPFRGGRQELANPGRAVPVAANRQKVHAVTDENLVFEQRLPRGRHADHHLVLIRQPAHQSLKGCEQRHEQRTALTGTGLLHRLIQFRVDAAAEARSLEGLLGWPRPIGGQLQRFRPLGELVQPKALGFLEFCGFARRL